MKFKALKHKTLPDTFGVFDDWGSDTEICHSSTPQILGLRVTVKDLQDYCFNDTTAFEQLKDYDLVTVQITVLD